MLYLGDQMLTLHIYKLRFQFYIPSPIDNVLLFQSCMIVHMVVSKINQFLVVWPDISHILYVTVTYLHIITIENFIKQIYKKYYNF